MVVCGADVETTGLDPLVDKVIEIGAIKWDVKEGDWKEVGRFSSLLNDGETKLSEKIISLTGITQDLLDREGRNPKDVFNEFEEFCKGTEMFIAHNAPFDKPFVEEGIDTRRPWVCTINDLKHPEEVTGRKLAHMALDYGVAVDPSTLHRAVSDVELMGEVLRVSGAAPEEMLRYHNEPDVYAGIDIPPPWEDGEEGKEFAKSIGFCFEGRKHWDKTFPKKWVKKVKESKVSELKEQVGGRYRLIKLA